MLDSRSAAEVVRTTFEEMAFLDVSEGKTPAGLTFKEEGPVLYLGYSHPKTGAFALFLPKEIKFQVAEAIYGEDWKTLSATQLDDSLLELVNVMAGRLLTHRFSGEPGYRMGLPTVLYDPPEDLPGAIRTDFLFHSDENPFTLVWYEVPA